MQNVKLPDGRILNFPDEMSQEEMSVAIQKNFPEFAVKEPEITPEIEQMLSNQPAMERQMSVAALNPDQTPDRPITGGVHESRKDKMDKLRMGLETAGMMAGGAITSPGIVTTVGGAALGHAMGAKTADVIEQFTKPTYGEHTYSREQPGTLTGQLGQSAKDIGAGAAYEVGGRIIGKALPAIVGSAYRGGKKITSGIADKLPALTEKQSAKRVAQEIKKTRSKQPQYQENLKQAAKVSDEIGGDFKASLGEMTNDPGLIKLQRGLEAAPGGAAEIQVMRRADNTKAIREYLEENFDKKRSISEVTDFFKNQEKQLTSTIRATEEAATASKQTVPRAMPQETGERILKEIEAARAPVREIEKEYWSKVPNYEMQTNVTKDIFEDLAKRPSTVRKEVRALKEIYEETPKTVDEMHVFEQELNSIIFAPTATATEKRVFGQIKTALAKDFEALGKAAEQGDFATYKGKVVHPKKLQRELADIDAKLKSEQVVAESTPDANKMYSELQADGKALGAMRQRNESIADHSQRIAKQYTQLTGKKPIMIPGQERPTVTSLKTKKLALEKTLEGSKEAKNAAIAYKNAKAYSKSQSIDRFKKGVVAELTKSGGEKVASEVRPKKLMSLSSADQFIKAIGKEKAGDVMLRHYADDMMETVKLDKTGNLSSASLTNWFNKHKRVLDKYGIDGAFKNIDSAHKSMAAAREASTEFNKSLAAKMLNADPGNAIKAAFSGGEGISSQNTGEIMRNLVSKLQGNKDAIKGLESGFKDFMVETMETTAKTIKEDRVLSPASLSKAIRRYKPAMAVLYKGQPQKIKALQTVQKALELQGRSAKSPLGGGSDTSEKIGAVSKLANILLTKTPIIGHAIKLGKMGLSGMSNMSKKETNDFLLKALYDPKYADILVKASRKKPPVTEISNALGLLLPATVKAVSEKDNK